MQKLLNFFWEKYGINYSRYPLKEYISTERRLVSAVSIGFYMESLQPPKFSNIGLCMFWIAWVEFYDIWMTFLCGAMIKPNITKTARRYEWNFSGQGEVVGVHSESWWYLSRLRQTQVIQNITSTSVLALYDSRRDIFLSFDSSSYGLVIIIKHKQLIIVWIRSWIRSACFNKSL